MLLPRTRDLLGEGGRDVLPELLEPGHEDLEGLHEREGLPPGPKNPSVLFPGPRDWKREQILKVAEPFVRAFLLG